MSGLCVTNLIYKYPAGATVRAEFAVVAGGCAVLTGISGVGKSTVLNLIAGLLKPQAGEIIFDRQNLYGIAPAARPLTYLFQNDNLFAHLTVWQNIAIGLHPNMRITAADKDAINVALVQVGLSDFAERRPPTLSGGQAQRVAIARCLVRRRALLLLDEPFAGIDSERSNKLIAILKKMQHEQGTTILLTAHNQTAADALNAQIIKM